MRARVVTWTETVAHEAVVHVPDTMSDQDLLDADEEDWYKLVEGKADHSEVEHRQILSIDDLNEEYMTRRTCAMPS